MAKDSRCPYCLDDLVGAERVVRCVSCRTPHHKVCFDEHGGCVAFGCGGVGSADAGQSIMLQRHTIELGARWREARLMPLPDQSIRYRPARRIAEEQHEGPIGPWVRISLEQEKLYPGQDLKARIVVAVTRDTVVRRLELRVFDEPVDWVDTMARPARLLTARILGRQPFRLAAIVSSMVGFARPSPRLRPGLHPYQIEIPRIFGNLIPDGGARVVQVGAVLERVGAQTVASPRVTIVLTPVPAREVVAVGGGRYPGTGDPANAVILHNGVDLLAGIRQTPFAMAEAAAMAMPTRREEVEAPPFPSPSQLRKLGDLELGGIDEVRPPAPVLEPVDDPHRAGKWPAIVVPAPVPEMPLLPATPGEDLIGPPREGDSDTNKNEDFTRPRPAPAPVAPVVSSPGPDPRPGALGIVVKTRATPPPTADGWLILPFRSITTAGPRTGRVLRARFAPRGDVPPLRISLEVAPRPEGADPGVLELTIDAPKALGALDLACRYELSDFSGREVAIGKFPMLEEVCLVGDRALPADRTGKDDRLQVHMVVDPFLVEEARGLRGPDNERGKELILRLACEAILPTGSQATSGTRIVRVPLVTT